jgi:chromate reductase
MTVVTRAERIAEETRPRVRLLGLSGSLRRASHSTAILRELQAELGSRVALDIFVPRLPLYDEDEQAPEALESVERLRSAITAADGVIICTPEYNHGAPGVLKNALDWVSRPSGKSALRSKPVLIVSNSPGFTGGVRAQVQLQSTLLAMHAHILPGREVVIGGIADKLRDGRFIDRGHLAFALAAVVRLVEFCSPAPVVDAS